MQVAAHAEFPDHHPYSQTDLAQLEALARSRGATALLTTRKDAVRLRDLSLHLPTYALEVALETNDGTPIETRWQQLLQASHAPANQARPRSLSTTLVQSVGYLLLRALGWAAGVFPEPVVYWLGRRIGGLAYAILPDRRRFAHNNLTLAFGKEMSPQQLRALCRRHFRFVGETLMEFLRLPRMSADELRARVVFRDEPFLREAYARGKGVVLLTAHFGNWEWMGARISQDYALSALARPADDPGTRDLINFIRRSAGSEVIDTNDVRGAIRSLRGGRVLGILLDQNTATHALFPEFFDKKAATATGPVVLAKRTGAAIIPMFCVRRRPGHHEVHCMPAVHISEAQDPDTVLTEVQRCTSIIEDWVRRYPDHWLWMHDRWRTRPPEETPSRNPPRNAAAANPGN
jgi:KDO2-lipid IV(A) lauroyltransferase